MTASSPICCIHTSPIAPPYRKRVRNTTCPAIKTHRNDKDHQRRARIQCCRNQVVVLYEPVSITSLDIILRYDDDDKGDSDPARSTTRHLSQPYEDHGYIHIFEAECGVMAVQKPKWHWQHKSNLMLCCVLVPPSPNASVQY